MCTNVHLCTKLYFRSKIVAKSLLFSTIICIFAQKITKTMKKLLTIVGIWMALIQNVTAQYFSMSLPLDNVMSSYHIRCVTQDKKGFLWMGSVSGLYRYDGYRYQRIREHDNPTLLPDESVQNIVSWGDRYMWIRLRGELYSCYDTEDNRFVDWSGNATNNLSYHKYYIADAHHLWLYDNKRGCRHIVVGEDGKMSSTDYSLENKSLPSNHINFVIQDHGDNAWIGTDKGLVSIRNGKTHNVIKQQVMACAQQMGDGSICFVSEQGHVYQTQKGGWLSVFTPKPLLTDKVRRIAREQHQLIIATAASTYCYDTRLRTLTPHPYIHVDNLQIVEDNVGNKVVFDHDGQDVWYLAPEKTYHLTNIYSKELTRQNGGGRFKFAYGSHGRIWISTYGNGLFSYNTQTGEMNHYTHAGGVNSLIASDFLLNIYEDHSGRTWVCEENQGVRYLGEISQHRDIRYFTTPEDHTHANTVRLIKPVGDKVFVGNHQGALWTTDQHLQNTQTENPYGDDVVAVTIDRQDRLWVGTRSRGIFVDGVPLEPAVKGKVSDILCDHKGRIWISIFDGCVNMVTTTANGKISIRRFFEGNHAVEQPRSMIEDHEGRIWLCSNKGVYLFRPEQLMQNDSAYLHINVSGANSNSDEVHCLYEDSKQRIWAGTTGYGLARLDSHGNVVRRFSDKDGLPNNSIESIIEDANGRLWAGTGYGLARYVEEDDRFNAFLLSNTPLGQMYTEGCAALLEDGRLAMGTLHGMQVFNPADIKPLSSIFPLTLTDVHINGVSIRDMEEAADINQMFSQEQKLRLNYDQNSLTFYFSTFEFIATRIVKYAYMLEGVDKEWSEASTQNAATYKNLRPGHYTLHVRSYNIYGLQSEHEISLDITIDQPWWNTWWAWLIYLLIIGSIVWIAWNHYRQVSELQTKIKVENQLTEYKLRFFTNISHEFRTPLTIIRGAMERIGTQGELPSNLKQPFSSMQKSCDRLLRLINELLVFRKIQNEKLRLSLEETDVVEFLRNIFLTFKETAENREINYQFSTPVKELNTYIDRNFVDKMAYNLLSNAFKYTGRKKEIAMRLKTDDGKLFISVEDTGIGIAKEKQAALFTRFNQSEFSRDSIGIGLHMVQELVRVHHGTIHFEENPVGGSIFTIMLPTDKSVYNEDDFLSDNELLTEADTTPQQTTITYKEMATPPMNDHRVLVVDDDDDIREFLYNELRRYFVIEQAYNGEEALEKIKAARPSLVISDVKMPVMNGFELIRKIRQDQELSDLPVILLTAVTDEEKVVKGTEYGADAYIPKPFNIKLLTAKCRALIEQRDKLRVRYAKEVVGQAPMAEIIVEDADKKFLERFDNWIYANLSRSDMQAMDFANSMKMGRTTFFKKVKQVTGMPPHEYIKKIRMQHAIELLKDPTQSIAEVSYQTGFDDPNYFSRTFKEYFGLTASQFRKGGKPNPNGTPPATES